MLQVVLLRVFYFLVSCRIFGNDVEFLSGGTLFLKQLFLDSRHFFKKKKKVSKSDIILRYELSFLTFSGSTNRGYEGMKKWEKKPDL